MNPVFEGSWGASDEDLFNKSLERLKTLHASGKPFFSLIFSSSNHEPFQFPDGRIKLHDAEKQTVNNAVKYADYALGRFIAEAKKQDYWKDTVFLIVADHDNRVYGDSLVPIKKFHIPGLILGADVQPKRITTIASQVDLAPTLLSLLGVSSEHPMIGRDLARDSDTPGRALIQFDNYFAWLEGSSATILRPGQAPLGYDAATGVLTTGGVPDAQLVDKAMSHVVLPSLLYREQRYSCRRRNRRRPSCACCWSKTIHDRREHRGRPAWRKLRGRLGARRQRGGTGLVRFRLRPDAAGSRPAGQAGHGRAA
jgi:hypothetical protein